MWKQIKPLKYHADSGSHGIDVLTIMVDVIAIDLYLATRSVF